MRIVLLCVELAGLIAVVSGVFLLLGLGAALILAGLVSVAAVEWHTRSARRVVPR